MGAKKGVRAKKVTKAEADQAARIDQAMSRAKVAQTAKRQPANDDVFAELARRVPHGRRARVGSAFSRQAANDNPVMALVNQVEGILRDTVSVIARMPAGRYCFPSEGGSGWPDIVRDYWESAAHAINDMPRVTPTEAQIKQAMEVVAKLSKLPSRDRKLISVRLMNFSFVQIGKEFGGISKEKARGDYQLALFGLAMLIADSDCHGGQSGVSRLS